MSRLKPSTLLILGAMPIFFGVSLLLLSYYKLGDQEIYHLFYELLSTRGISDVMNITGDFVSLGDSEPIARYTLWVGAQLDIPKDIYISILNVILLTGLVLFIRKYNAPWYIYALLLTNFYLFVLMTGAERLKIAYIMLLYATLVPKRTGFVLALASPLAHLSSIILLVSVASARARDVFREIFLNITTRRYYISALCFFVIASIIGFLYVKDAVFLKATAYMGQYGGITGLFNILILLTIGLFVCRDRFRLLMSMLPMLGAAFLIGGTRVNMLAVSVFIYLLLIENRLNHPLVVLLLAYFSLKSIPFIGNIFMHQNGFGGQLF